MSENSPSHMAARIHARSSLVPMCIFEYITGPRMLGKGAHSRFKFESQFAKVFSRLYSSRAGYHHSWRARHAHLEAASEFFSSLAIHNCPVTLLKFDFSSCTSACTNRLLDMSIILQWAQDPTSHAVIMKREFDTYVRSWEELSLVLLPAHSSAEAFNRADRLRRELMPSSTAMNESIMNPLNSLVQDLNARNCTVRVHTPSTWMPAREHNRLSASATPALTSTNESSNSASPTTLGDAGSTGTIGLDPSTRGNNASLNGDDPPTTSASLTSNRHSC